MTARDLSEAERRYRDAAAGADEALVARNEAIRTALREGWTHAQIAQATGLTRGRIGQLAKQ